MLQSRVSIGLGLAFGASILLYLKYELILFILVQGASVYDLTQLHKLIDSNIKRIIFFGLTTSILGMNWILLLSYWRSPWSLIELVTLTQVSDVLQYYGGHLFGRTRIGSISPNKTYEGYLFSFIILISSTILGLGLVKVVSYWMLGVAGGLTNSLIKRYFGVKDFSNILGQHGGYLDRADSIYLPALMAHLIEQDPIKLF